MQDSKGEKASERDKEVRQKRVKRKPRLLRVRAHLGENGGKNGARYIRLSPEKWDGIYERIAIILGTKDQQQIASRFRCRLEDLEAYRKEGVIPDSWRIQLYEMYGVRPLWLITGQGPKSLLDTNIPQDFISCLSGKILMMLSEVEEFSEYTPLQIYTFYQNIEFMIKDILEKSALGINNRIDTLC